MLQFEVCLWPVNCQCLIGFVIDCGGSLEMRWTRLVSWGQCLYRRKAQPPLFAPGVWLAGLGAVCLVRGFGDLFAKFRLNSPTFFQVFKPVFY